MGNGPKRWGALTAAALVALLALPPAAAAASGTAEARLIAEGSPPDLILLYTGDVIGYVGPCG